MLSHLEGRSRVTLFVLALILGPVREGVIQYDMRYLFLLYIDIYKDDTKTQNIKVF